MRQLYKIHTFLSTVKRVALPNSYSSFTPRSR